MPSTPHSTRRIAVVVGAATAVVGIVLTGVFLAVTTDGGVGSSAPFTTLTAGDGVSPPTAATWTFLDAQLVSPSIAYETSDGASIFVTRNVLDVLDGTADGYWILRLVPPLVLACAGALSAALSERLGADVPGRARSVDGMRIVLGYAPVLVLAAWLASVPVAPDASGGVKIGSTIVDAAGLIGVTAGPDLSRTVMAGLLYPMAFGALGGALSTLPRRVTTRLATVAD